MDWNGLHGRHSHDSQGQVALSLVDRWFGNVGLFGKVSLWQVPGRAGAGQLCIVPC